MSVGPNRLIATFSGGVPRDDFTGEVGMAFTLTKAMPVNMVGMLGTGATATRRVTIWLPDRTTVIAQAMVNVIGSQSFDTNFNPVTPAILAAGQQYLLTASVVNGDGKSWYERGGITLYNAVQGNGTVYATHWVNVTDGPNVDSPDQCFMGVDCTFLDATPGSANRLVTSYSPGTDRNDFTGGVGFSFMPTAPVTFNRIGVKYPTHANNGPKTVGLYMWPSITPIVVTQVDVTGGFTGTFYYTDIPPQTLAAGTGYAVMATTTSGGQYWSELGAMSAKAGIGSVQGCYTPDFAAPNNGGSNTQWYGVDLDYIAAGGTVDLAGDFSV